MGQPFWKKTSTMKPITKAHKQFVTIILKIINPPVVVFAEYQRCSPNYWSETLDSGFEGFDNVSGITNGRLIIPNYIHYLRHGNNLKNVNFIDAVCILSAFRNHKPEKIFFHTYFSNFEGKYWDILLKMPGFEDIIEFVYLDPIDSVFGQPLHSAYKAWHESDILRIKILQKYGGICIDNDVFVVRNMDELRKFEMVMDVHSDTKLGMQTLIAHRDARFLALWLDSYKEYYGHLWYYNAGEKPRIELLNIRPELVHNAYHQLGARDLRVELYARNWQEWRNQFTIHLLIRHLQWDEEVKHNPFNLTYPVTFDETNIAKYKPTTISEMVLDCCPELLN